MGEDTLLNVVCAPEDRLRTMWIAGLILLPVLLMGTGWLTQTG